MVMCHQIHQCSQDWGRGGRLSLDGLTVGSWIPATPVDRETLSKQVLSSKSGPGCGFGSDSLIGDI